MPQNEGNEQDGRNHSSVGRVRAAVLTTSIPGERVHAHCLCSLGRTNGCHRLRRIELAIGDKAFAAAGEVRAKAPSLPYHELEV